VNVEDQESNYRATSVWKCEECLKDHNLTEEEKLDAIAIWRFSDVADAGTPVCGVCCCDMELESVRVLPPSIKNIPVKATIPWKCKECEAAIKELARKAFTANVRMGDYNCLVLSQHCTEYVSVSPSWCALSDTLWGYLGATHATFDWVDIGESVRLTLYKAYAFGAASIDGDCDIVYEGVFHAKDVGHNT